VACVTLVVGDRLSPVGAASRPPAGDASMPLTCPLLAGLIFRAAQVVCRFTEPAGVHVGACVPATHAAPLAAASHVTVPAELSVQLHVRFVLMQRIPEQTQGYKRRAFGVQDEVALVVVGVADEVVTCPQTLYHFES
jgi:hypothetical protein